jgi:hypothetical protein
MKYTTEQEARLYNALLADGVDNWNGYFTEGGNLEREVREIEAENKRKEMRDKITPLIEIIEESIEVDFPAGRECGHRAVLSDSGVEAMLVFLQESKF